MVRVELKALGDLPVGDVTCKRGDVVAEVELPSEDAMRHLQAHLRAGRIVLHAKAEAKKPVAKPAAKKAGG